MNRETQPGGADPILLLEAVLVLLLFALFLLLYVQPVGSGEPVQEWWTAPVLGALFFGILLMERWRRKKRDRGALSRGVPVVEGDQPEDGP